MARWCLQYTIEGLEKFQSKYSDRYKEFVEKTWLSSAEQEKWKEIVELMYFPFDEERQIFLQQDGFLDKEYIPVSELSSTDKPINIKWSCDRILRSCFIKQADVLQSMYFFEDHFSKEEIERHFDYYEPITVHESSLSPCVHAILASSLDRYDKAYEMYLRTARLDLDDYNADSDEGCHITSMGGTWMSFVKGFGGMRVRDGHLHFSPFKPEVWERYSFEIVFRGINIEVVVSDSGTTIRNFFLPIPLL
jgi:maltose phosphorylase